MKQLFLITAFAFAFFSAKATTCAGATVIPAGATLPYTATLSCGSTNDITAANAPCGTNGYHGGREAVFAWTPSTSVATLNIGYSGQSWTGIFLYQGCPTSGGICLANITSSASSKVLTYAGTLSAGVTYYIVIDTYPNPVDPCPGTLTLSKPATNVFCAAPNPICTGTPIAFIANTGSSPASSVNSGNNYGCLASSPNPSWYYLKIATSGNLVVDITAASDVDFALWGPFVSLSAAESFCNGYGSPVSCSYSTSATEHAVVNGAVAGQVYVLLVTNYANSVQTITINQSASNTATTDCTILPLPVDLSEWNAAFEDEKVYLTWTTQHEYGNRIFRIQRSGDGYLWETIGVKAGAATTSLPTNYSFVDESPLEGISYYRLQQVDADGQINYTPVLSVLSTPENEISIYPNPTTKYITVQEGKAKIADLNVIDIVGKTRDVEISFSSNSYTLNCEHLEAGVYFAEYNVNGKKLSRKFCVVGKSE